MTFGDKLLELETLLSLNRKHSCMFLTTTDHLISANGSVDWSLSQYSPIGIKLNSILEIAKYLSAKGMNADSIKKILFTARHMLVDGSIVDVVTATRINMPLNELYEVADKSMDYLKAHNKV